MNNFLKQLLLSFLITTFIWTSSGYTQEKKGKFKYNLRELVLPSEVKTIGKSSGSIFYSPSVKGKVLIPVHFWGEVSKSGLHFLPIDTNFINGLSLAGGPTAGADLEIIKLTRKSEKGEYKSQFFDLSKGGSSLAHEFKLKPDDTVFIKTSRFYEDRSYYTSLTGVIATVLSSIILYREVRK